MFMIIYILHFMHEYVYDLISLPTFLTAITDFIKFVS